MTSKNERETLPVQDEQNGGDHKPSTPSFKFKHLPSPNITFLKEKTTMAVYGANHNSLTRKNEHYNHIITYKRCLPTVNDCPDLILNYKNEDEIETN